MSPATFQHPPPPVIDPALVPLPSDRDDNLIVPSSIAQSQGRAASPKIAGSRRPGKGATTSSSVNKSRVSKGKEKENIGVQRSKKRQQDVIDLDDEEETKAKRGRPQGAGNYSVGDMTALLNYVEEELPLGQRGWAVVATKFNKWAAKHGRPDRKITSLETKFKQVRNRCLSPSSISDVVLQLVRTPKPTGTGVCPPEVLRAHSIDDLINEWAGTHELNDSDFEDVAEKPDSSDEDRDNVKPDANTSRTAVASRRATQTEASSTRRNTRGVAAAELMSRLSTAFNPEVQKARDEECTNRALATTQYLTLSQQLRDAQVTNDKLHSKIFDLRNELYEMQHKYDCVQMRYEMLKMSGTQRRQPKTMYHNLPKHKHQGYRWFADGGEAIEWVPTDEEDTNWNLRDGYQAPNSIAEASGTSKSSA